MRRCSLQKTKLNAADFNSDALVENRCEHYSKAAELHMPKAVVRRGLGLGNKAAVGIVNALGHDDECLALFLINALDIGAEAVHVKIALGQVNEVGAAALI